MKNNILNDNTEITNNNLISLDKLHIHNNEKIDKVKIIEYLFKV